MGWVGRSRGRNLVQERDAQKCVPNSWSACELFPADTNLEFEVLEKMEFNLSNFFTNEINMFLSFLYHFACFHS